MNHANLAREMRRKAALCRRAAAIPTKGGKRTDRRLVALAEELEREAQKLDAAASNKDKKT